MVKAYVYYKMVKAYVYYTAGKIVILDSEFCVLKMLTELCKKNVFAVVVIKKRSRYCPKYVDGDAIKHL
jgi:Transposase IS4